PRLGTLHLRKRHVEHAVLVFGLDPFGVHHHRKRERTREGAVRTLGPENVLPLYFLLTPSLTPKGQDAVLHLDVDVVLIDLWELRLDNDVLSVLIDVAEGSPRTHRLLSGPQSGEGGVREDAVDSLLKCLEVIDEGLEPDDSHCLASLSVYGTAFFNLIVDEYKT